MNKMLLLIIVTAMAVLGGCATNAYVSPHFVVTGGTADLGAGREAAVVELCRRDPADKRTVEEIRKDPASAACIERSMQFALGTNITRDIATGAVPVVLGALTQGHMAERAIKKQAEVCKDGKCGGPAAASGSAASNTTNVIVTTTMPCAATNSCGNLGD